MRLLQIPACIDNFAEVRAFTKDFCTEADVDSNLSYRLLLVLEELFSNTITHGYRGADGMVRIELKQVPGYICIRYEDTAPPFDPINAVSLDPAIAIANEQIGGMGLPLIRKMADSLTYERQEPWNRITLMLTSIYRLGAQQSPELS